MINKMRALFGESAEEQVREFNKAFRQDYVEHKKFGSKDVRSLDNWLKCLEITDYDIENYPNAKKAAQIKASPLGKALE